MSKINQLSSGEMPHFCAKSRCLGTFVQKLCNPEFQQFITPITSVFGGSNQKEEPTTQVCPGPSSHVSFGILASRCHRSRKSSVQKSCGCRLVLRNVTATARAGVTSSGSVDPNESDQIRGRPPDTRSIRHDHRGRFTAT